MRSMASALFFEVNSVTLLVALDEHPEEAKEKLHVLFRPGQGEGIDREIARLLANIEVGAAEDRCQGLKATANVKDECQRRILLGVL
jgi:hypothetical protein